MVCGGFWFSFASLAPIAVNFFPVSHDCRKPQEYHRLLETLCGDKRQPDESNTKRFLKVQAFS
jgi:hypothetical protein